MRSPLLIVALLLAVASPLFATSVRPPTFDELVSTSDAVVHATVKTLRCEWRGTGDARHIETVVTLAVNQTIVGTPAHEIQLEFLGGEIDGEGMLVEGQPTFHVGDEDFLFVQGNTRQFCPLVAMNYGRYLFARDDRGLPFVARANGVPLTAPAEISLPMSDSSSAKTLAKMKGGQGLTPDAFAAAIRESATRQGRTDVQP